jgi:hypothetical protein
VVWRRLRAEVAAGRDERPSCDAADGGPACAGVSGRIGLLQGADPGAGIASAWWRWDAWPWAGQGRHPVGYCQGRRRWAIDRRGDNPQLRHNEHDHAPSGLRGCREHQPADSDSHNNTEAAMRAHNGTYDPESQSTNLRSAAWPAPILFLGSVAGKTDFLE